ncbi:MAG TPA: FtsX-like permease family protein [Anaerolineae bacterium]|nr:FtsX-like permease family protein [Anaerolineae bacterium]
MPLTKLWTIAYRDLGRHRRRSAFTLLAVALGLGLLLWLDGLISGVVADSLANSIRLRTGHVQIRAASFQEDQLSLQAKDLLPNPDELVAKAKALSEVKAAAPVLWASTILNTIDQSIGLQLMGIDTTSPLYDPIRAGVVAGNWLAPDDREGILIGRGLADSLGLGVDQKVNLTLVNSDGKPDEGTFTIRGLFSTGIPSYDQSAVFMPLDKAQAFTGASGEASLIQILLNNQNDADKVAAALSGPGVSVPTWSDLNAVFVQTMATAMSFYAIMDFIVILIVAVIIVNTLLMSVFERFREMGILASLGMKGGQIRLMFLLEAATLGLMGIVLGILIGGVGVWYLATTGIPIGDKMAAVAGSNFALSATMYGRFDVNSFINLSLATLIVVVLASLYPAFYASRLEPVEALRAD